MLAHEHVMSTFGAEPAARAHYDDAAVLAAVSPPLQALRELGVGTIIDATAAYFGRDPRLLRTISEKTGVHLVTNTGYYGAANGRYLPADIATLSPPDVAARWIAEWRDGIGDTGIRPGYLKLGVNPGPLRDVDRLLLAAAARTHLATGLTIAVHTGANPESAAEQMDLLSAEGVSPEAWVWIHAHQVLPATPLIEAARKGAWISLDGWNPATASRDIETLRQLKEAGQLHRVLLSHDGNLHPANGARPRPIDWLLREGQARLKAAGFTDDDWRQMTTVNAAAAYAVRIRKQGP
jgi:phosphotriesterase-related protein